MKTTAQTILFLNVDANAPTFIQIDKRTHGKIDGVARAT